jgi:hypothetical protein
MNHKQKNWTIFFGIVTALVVVFSQLFWFQAADFGKKLAKTEQQADVPDTEAHISLPSTSLPAPNTIQTGQEFSFLHEILFEAESENKPEQSLALVAGKFFTTLFRTLISPNAP